jgi:outer membrane protein assembly factor BamD
MPHSAVSVTMIRALCISAAGSVLLLAGCHTTDRDLNRASVEKLYSNAHKAMDNGDYQYAIKNYEALAARFPFTDQARQARLDLIYVYYRKGETESAEDAADQFLRENPTHPRVDYAWYMKGMIDYERIPNWLEKWFGVDMAKRPPTTALKSIAAFNTVVTQYPKSVYAHDALRRMIYLRNRLAQYEIVVARYYYRRGAYLAAARRAEHVISEYDGATVMPEALQIMSNSYARLGLADLKANVDRVYADNYPGGKVVYDNSATVPGTVIDNGKRPWWRLW